jgi:predicted AAA+ superfamily ATPase
VRRLGSQFPSFVEINFERLEGAAAIFEKDLIPEKLLLSLSLLLKTPIVPGETLLFLDEVQEAPRAITALRSFYEEMPQLHLIAAGSLLEFAIAKEGIPVGRVSMLYMYPFSFMEYLVATGNRLRSLHMFLALQPQSTSAIRFSALNYSLEGPLDSRPLYAAASLAHPQQKEALQYPVS